VLDQAERLREFPTLAEMTYLNTAAEGIPPRAVHDALQRYYQDKLRGMVGREAHYATRNSALELVAQMYGLSPDEVTICSCSSEAFNLAATALQLKEGDEVVITDLDFPASASPWLQSSCPGTAKVWRARADGGLRVEDLVPLLGPKTRMVTFSVVSFLNGFMLDPNTVAGAVRKHSPALLAADVTQALGRVPLDLHEADLIVSSTHKWLLGSHGGGLVGVPKRSAGRLTARAGGWFNLQDPYGPESFTRAVSKPGAASFAVGMPNFPAIYAIQAALKYMQGVGVQAIDRHARPLVNHCLDELLKLSVKMTMPAERSSLAGILTFTHPRLDKIHAHLLSRNVHVMCRAGRIRVSIHGYNTAGDVERLLATLSEGLDLR
jgi:cysteine desulfurase / selenocysteine lyase